MNLSDDQKKQFGEEFLDAYLKRGFGSMNKNDFEVLIFSILRKIHVNQEMSNYDWCLSLRIPETKVRKLSYEADLIYTDYNEDKLREKFFKLINNVVFSKDGQNIKFVIEDKTLRSMVSADLKSLGRFSDYSFNTEVVSISIKSFSALMGMYYKDKSNEILSYCKQKLKKEDNNLTFSQLYSQFLLGLARGTGEVLPEMLMEIACSYHNPIKIASTIIKVLS